MGKKDKHISIEVDDLINIRHHLTVKQNVLLDMILCQIKDDNKYRYELNINKYKQLYREDLSNFYIDLKKTVEELKNKGFSLINSENKTEVFFEWFASIIFSDNDSKITVELGQTMKELLLEIKKDIFYKVEYPILNFRSIYSNRLYDYLLPFCDTKYHINKFDDLINILQCPKSYQSFGMFKKHILKQAQKEINNLTDIYFEFIEIKTGRKVTSVKFIINSNETTKSTKYSAQEMLNVTQSNVSIKEENDKNNNTEFKDFIHKSYDDYDNEIVLTEMERNLLGWDN
ncbi:replication initiation protein [Oceanirhabdus sp. W0125-5]|uniref:replication initiation protein n=1 Tax=Oceanirhabdus sp. W0125-5 TaxID=2999116 RepID=UPI0022F2CDE4|nr:replication initiation protein [Oceanirhabdus sp. W0125-5]WBW96061.1 replication initiation protein [Oceanirhabdus sp. W0125-5]